MGPDRYCPQDCTKKTNCATSTACPTVSAPATVTATITSTVSSTPLPRPVCANEIPYINLFTFTNDQCSNVDSEGLGAIPILGDALGELLGHAAFDSPPTKINATNSTYNANIGYGYYTRSPCVPLTVPEAHSAFFTVDGLDGTRNIDCEVQLYPTAACDEDGPFSYYALSRSTSCVSIDDAEGGEGAPPIPESWSAARLYCYFLAPK